MPSLISSPKVWITYWNTINIDVKKHIVHFCCDANGRFAAQNSTASPYSLGGLGDVTFRGNAIEHDVYADSIHANINNPASLGELKLTTFSVGVHYKNTQLTSSEANENVTSSSLDYIVYGVLRLALVLYPILL